MKRIGILTGGGDAPGLNAVIRAAVKTAINEYDCEVLGIRDGFDGFIETEGVIHLDHAAVRGILPRGGTILGTANRGNPFAHKEIQNGEEVIIDASDRVLLRIDDLEMDALIVVGGDGTLKIARELYDKGVPTVGVPKTIDNDVGGTEITFGFNSALEVATDSIDRLHTTAESHHRVMLLELMGRDAGFIALHAGIAGGADVILIPEIPYSIDSIARKIEKRIKNSTYFSIIAVSEGAKPKDGQQVYSITGDEVYAARLGGIAEQIAHQLARKMDVETRATVLGHLQRGGSPTPFDRMLATRYGAASVRLAARGGFGRMVALQNGRIVDVALQDALAVPKRVDLQGDAMTTARNLGISFGDD